MDDGLAIVVSWSSTDYLCFTSVGFVYYVFFIPSTTCVSSPSPLYMCFFFSLASPVSEGIATKPGRKKLIADLLREIVVAIDVHEHPKPKKSLGGCELWERSIHGACTELDFYITSLAGLGVGVDWLACTTKETPNPCEAWVHY
ncbi:hypothetical protein LXL04_012535 [Taraxacum kok-saghyz]